MNTTPAILPCMKILDFLEHIQNSHVAPTTVIICSPRESFLDDLAISMSEMNLGGEGNEESTHPFMVPTLHQLATSRTVTMAFTPTLAHLRAYFAVFKPDSEPRPEMEPQRQGNSLPLLAIYGFLELHRSTSEYSAQGLSRTLAIAIEAAIAARRRLIISESPKLRASEELMEADEADEAYGVDLLNPWREQIPLLTGSIRLGGREDRTWAGRTVEAARVVRRWCNFIQL